LPHATTAFLPNPRNAQHFANSDLQFLRPCRFAYQHTMPTMLTHCSGGLTLCRATHCLDPRAALATTHRCGVPAGYQRFQPPLPTTYYCATNRRCQNTNTCCAGANTAFRQPWRHADATILTPPVNLTPNAPADLPSGWLPVYSLPAVLPTCRSYCWLCWHCCVNPALNDAL